MDTLGLTASDITSRTIEHEAVRVHEAAHMTWALRCGVPVTESVVDLPTTPGTPHTGWTNTPKTAPMTADQWVVMALIGGVAQQHWIDHAATKFGFTFDPFDCTGSGDRELVSQHLPHSSFRSYDAALNETRRTFEQLKGSITRNVASVHTRCHCRPGPPTQPIPEPERPAAPAPERRRAPAPAAATPRSEPAPATTITGGTTAMGIEEMRAALGQVEHLLQTVAHQVGAATPELVNASALLAQLAQGTQQPELEQTVGQLRVLVDQLDQIPAQLFHATETTTGYAGRL